jgi:hypothetical protein
VCCPSGYPKENEANALTPSKANDAYGGAVAGDDKTGEYVGSQKRFSE